MRIFIIPFDQMNHLRASIRLKSLINEIIKNDNQVVGVERIPYFGTQNRILKYILLIIYLNKVIFCGLKYRKKVDLILSDALPFGLIGAILSILIKKPFIWNNQDGNILAHCKFLNIGKTFLYLCLFIEKLIGYAAKVIIVLSEKDKQLYIEQNFKYENKVKVIYPGFDFSAIEKIKENKISLRKKLGFDPEKRILIFGGKRDEYPPNKEMAFWINDKLAPVLEKNFNNFQIMITGPGDVPQKINPVVKFTGNIPNYFEYIFVSDVGLVPSNMDMGISLKLIDYLACGRPTITTSEVASLFPWLVDGKNIIIARDRQEFIEKTIYILNHPEEGEKIGARGKEVIEKYYDMKVIGKAWLDLFKSCVRDNLKGGANNYA